MRGDKPSKIEPWFREYYTHLSRALELTAEASHLDFTSVVVRGYGHQFPTEYFPVIDKWARHERLPEMNPK